MPKTEEMQNEDVKQIVEEQDKYNVLTAVIYDVLASELPEKSQELIPGEGETIKQASGYNLEVDTSVIDELPLDPIPAETCAGIGIIGTLTIAEAIIRHIDRGKIEDASEVLKYLGGELLKEGNIIYTHSESTMVIGRGIIITGHVCTYVGKSLKWFMKFMPQPPSIKT